MALAYKRNPAHADKLLDKLTDYAVFHFKTEGDLIRKYAIDPRHAPFFSPQGICRLDWVDSGTRLVAREKHIDAPGTWPVIQPAGG
jgi:hypothetical protein